MTKTLTEQWKNGELIFGKTYWCSDDEGNVAKLVLVSEDRFYEWTLGTEVTKDVKEVLAPVPSYDEYKELVRKSDKLDKIMSDSATNKGDCQQIVEDNLNRQMKRLQEKLAIATKALKDILNDGDDYWDKDKAQEALKEMEGVK